MGQVDRIPDDFKVPRGLSMNPNLASSAPSEPLAAAPA
ncbi:hypothetical protein VARIO8X_110211 [Burkholderiales bacterium 8X]|nr:hypothetical protein VARIO8X_110211 [Burkholderiales bacterium 8X]